LSKIERAWLRPRVDSASTWSNRDWKSPEVICWVRNSASTAAETMVSTAVMTTVRSCRDADHRRRTVRHEAPAAVRTRDPRPELTASACSVAVTGPVVNSALARLVADAADGQDDLRLLRVLLDLGAQPLHVHVDEAGVRLVPVAPD